MSLFLQWKREREPQKSIPSAGPRLEGQVVGEYDSESDYGYDDKEAFPPYRHPVGVGVLEKIVRLPSSPVTVSCSVGVMLNALNDAAENAFYNRAL